MDQHRTDTVIDVDIPSAKVRFAKQRLRVDANTFAFGRKSIPVDQIDAVAYQVVNQMAAGVVRMATYCSFEVWGGGEHIVVKSATDSISKKRSTKMEDDFSGLVRYSQQVIEPRLRDEIVALLKAGTAVGIGPLTLDTEGLRVKRKLRDDLVIPWSAAPEGHFARGEVHISATVDQKRASVASVPMTTKNAVLLPELLGT